MSKLIILFYSLFFVGFFLKFFHIHYNAVLMLCGLGGILIIGLISLFYKEKRSAAILHIGIFSWLLFLLVSIKFFPFEIPALIFASVLSLFVIMDTIRKKTLMKLLPVGLCAAIALVFYLMPTDRRYYLFNVKWNYEIESDFMTLDKYSWFLYKNGNDDDAIKVSNQALEIAKKSGEVEWVDYIAEHANSIRMKTWKHYH